MAIILIIFKLNKNYFNKYFKFKQNLYDKLDNEILISIGKMTM